MNEKFTQFFENIKKVIYLHKKQRFYSLYRKKFEQIKQACKILEFPSRFPDVYKAGLNEIERRLQFRDLLLNQLQMMNEKLSIIILQEEKERAKFLKENGCFFPKILASDLNKQIHHFTLQKELFIKENLPEIEYNKPKIVEINENQEIPTENGNGRYISNDDDDFMVSQSENHSDSHSGIYVSDIFNANCDSGLGEYISDILAPRHHEISSSSCNSPNRMNSNQNENHHLQLENEISQLKLKIKELQMNNDSLSSSNDSLLKERSELEHDIKQLHMDSYKYMNEIKQLKKSNTQNSTNEDQQQQENQLLKQQLEQEKQKTLELQKENKELKQKIHFIALESEKLRLSEENMEKQFLEKASQFELFKQQHDDVMNEIQSLRKDSGELQILKLESTKLRTSEEQLDLRLQEKSSEFESLKQQHDHLMNEIQSLRKDSGELQILRLETTKLRTSEEQLDLQLRDKSSEFESLKQQFENYKNENSNLNSNEVKNLLSTIEKLTTTEDLLNNQVKEYLSEIKELQDQLQNQFDEHEKLKKQINEFSETNKDNILLIDQLQLQNDNKDSQIKTLEIQYAELSHDATLSAERHLREENSLKQKLSEREADLTSLSLRFQPLQSNLNFILDLFKDIPTSVESGNFYFCIPRLEYHIILANTFDLFYCISKDCMESIDPTGTLYACVFIGQVVFIDERQKTDKLDPYLLGKGVSYCSVDVNVTNWFKIQKNIDYNT